MHHPKKFDGKANKREGSDLCTVYSKLGFDIFDGKDTRSWDGAIMMESRVDG